MSTAILPFAVWAEGSNQARIPANDNSLRLEALSREIISQSVTAQPGSPADGDTYIIASTHTGAQWATFSPKDIAIYRGGTWYAWAPVEGLIVNVAGSEFKYDGGAWTAVGGGGGGGGSSTTVGFVFITGNGASHNFDPGTDAGKMHRFSGTGAKTFNLEPDSNLAEGVIVHVTNRGASGNVTIVVDSNIIAHPPKGGSLVLEPGDTISIHFVSATEADVFGSTL